MSVVPGNDLPFAGKLTLTGSRGTFKTFQDSAALNITTSNQLTASAYSLLGPLLNSWWRQLILGLTAGFLIYHFFFSKPKEELKFK